MQIAKWGNSLAVRLPASLVAELGLKEGDEIEVVISPEARSMEVQKLPGPAERLQSLRKFRGMIPDDFRFNREEANQR